MFITSFLHGSRRLETTPNPPDEREKQTGVPIVRTSSSVIKMSRDTCNTYELHTLDVELEETEYIVDNSIALKFSNSLSESVVTEIGPAVPSGECGEGDALQSG